MTKSFKEMLKSLWAQHRFVCVGLDTDPDLIPKSFLSSSDDPPDRVLAFNKDVVWLTRNIPCAYKLNLAFYSNRNTAGEEALIETIAHIHSKARGVPVILDPKRNDIGNTSKMYASFDFDHYGADAVTVNPFMGQDSIQPFLDRTDKGVIVLCCTSNPGSGEFQNLQVRIYDEEIKYLKSVEAIREGDYTTTLSNHIAYRVSQHWNKNDNCALVVGATHPHELATIRRIAPDLPLLIPGIGAQGGDLEATIKAGKDSRGQGMIINSSRGILYAKGGSDAPQRAAYDLHQQIRQQLQPQPA